MLSHQRSQTHISVKENSQYYKAFHWSRQIISQRVRKVQWGTSRGTHSRQWSMYAFSLESQTLSEGVWSLWTEARQQVTSTHIDINPTGQTTTTSSSAFAKTCTVNYKKMKPHIDLVRQRQLCFLLCGCPTCCYVHWSVWLCLFGYCWSACYENASLWCSMHHMEGSLGLWVIPSGANKTY